MFNWGAIGQGVAGTIQSGVGYYQYRKARKLRKEGERLMKEAQAKRTDYQIPDEIRNQYSLAHSEAFGKPAVQQAMENAADAEQSANLGAVSRYATSGADALAAAAGVNQQSRQGYNEAAIAGAQQRQQNMGNLYQAGNLLADYKSMAWDLNVNIPYLQRMQWAQDLIGAGYQGQNSGINTFVEGQNQIGESAANFFSFGGGGGGGASAMSSGGGGGNPYGGINGNGFGYGNYAPSDYLAGQNSPM